MNPVKVADNMAIAVAISNKSKDPQRKVGAYITTPDDSPVSLGYNGFVRGADDSKYRIMSVEEKLDATVHAEVNAIFNAARRGVSTLDTIMYCTLFPCPKCALAIIQAGIKVVVAPDTESLEPHSKWSAAMKISKKYFEDAKVKLVLLR